MSVSSYLTQKERAAILKVAAQTAVDELFDEQTKQANYAATAATAGGIGLGLAAKGVQTVAALSILTGIPVGLAWHALGEGKKISRNKERDALKRIEYYNNATKGIEQKLSSRGNR